jgi:hypothetical protein
MKRNHILIFKIFSILLLITLLGCGSEGPGSPGSDGTENTGLIVDAYVTPTYLDNNTNSVDAFQDFCGDEYEVFQNHAANVTISARFVNPSATYAPGNLYIEKYTVQYRRSADSIGAPPIETYIGYQTIVIPQPSAQGSMEVTQTLVFVDLLRKDQYAQDMWSGQYSSGLSYINNYTATYILEGKNELGEEFKIKANAEFQIGNFNNCD